jgi:predicted N-formylglutamate amidohydrolase
MTDSTLTKKSKNIHRQLLAVDEPGPFKVINALSEQAVLLVCDHASCRFPKSLGDMGLDPVARRCHLALDIGAGELTEKIAASLGVTAVVAQYSRLVVDCNRQLTDPGAYLEFGDGVPVPGNRGISQVDKDLRADTLYWPYHEEVGQQVQRIGKIGISPSFIAIHSFTPVMDGVARPWHMGVLWDTDKRLRDIFLQGFAAAGFVVGDNEPYSGKSPQDFTIDHHAETNGLPHVGIEIRQDLIDNDAGVEEIARLMHSIIESIPGRFLESEAGDNERPTSVHDRS